MRVTFNDVKRVISTVNDNIVLILTATAAVTAARSEADMVPAKHASMLGAQGHGRPVLQAPPLRPSTSLSRRLPLQTGTVTIAAVRREVTCDMKMRYPLEACTQLSLADKIQTCR